MQKRKRTYRFQSYDDDFVESADQARTLPDDYEWVRDGLVRRAGSAMLYGAGLVCARAYLSARLRWRAENRRVLDVAGRGGLMIYCNHTQPVGDALAPALALWPRRVYVVVSPANLGIPVLGGLLPALGALPVPATLVGFRKFCAAVSRRLEEGAAVVVYPEAHVWPWYTGIRPFPATSFAFAVENHVPAYSMTTTYLPRAHGGMPRATACLDGPFWPDESLPGKVARERLRDEVRAAMVERSRESTVEYVRYEEAPGAVPAAPFPARGDREASAS